MGVQNTEACQPQQSLQTSKCIHKACGVECAGESGKRQTEKNRKMGDKASADSMAFQNTAHLW